MSIYDILIEYKSIFGTILGSIVTLIVTHIIKKNGRLRFDFNNWKVDWYGEGELSSIEAIESFEKAKYLGFKFELIVYNGSEIPKSLKNICVEFKNSSNILIRPLKDLATKRHLSSGFMRIVDDIKVINLSPKQMTYIELEGYIPKEDYNKVKNNITKVYLVAKNHKRKKYKKGIAVINNKVGLSI